MIGLAAFYIAFLAGGIVGTRIFLSRDKGTGELISATIRSAAAGFLTMIGALIFLFGFAAVFGISKP